MQAWKWVIWLQFTLNDLVGEVTKRSLNGDSDYDYIVHYDRDGSIEWCEWSQDEK